MRSFQARTVLSHEELEHASPLLDYERLFSDYEMFDSHDTFERAGFTVKRRSNDQKIMVGSHPLAPTYLFKKFRRDVDREAQQENYRARVRGAEAIRGTIGKYRLDRLVVPHKWIYELPSKFGKRKRCAELLIVERLDLLDSNESKRRYQTIDKTTLKQLCRVLHRFRGFDAAVHNLRFTPSGQIAFFDTESCDRKPRPGTRVFRRLNEQLTKESKKIVERMFERLDDD